MDEIRKIFSSVENKFDDREKSVIHLITTDIVDRYGDIVVSSGMKDDNFSKNPVVLFMHNQYYPIGKSLWRKIEKDSQGEYVLTKTKFGKTELSEDVYNLYKDGVLNAWSIGFNPNWDKAEKLYDENNTFTGYRFNEWELLEYSAVSVPANPDALVIAIKSLKSEPLKQIFEYEQLKAEIEKFTQLEKRLKDLEYEVRNFDFQEIITLREAILDLQSKIENIGQETKKEAMEIVGDKRTIEEIVQRAVAGAISRIKGNLKN